MRMCLTFDYHQKSTIGFMYSIYWVANGVNWTNPRKLQYKLIECGKKSIVPTTFDVTQKVRQRKNDGNEKFLVSKSVNFICDDCDWEPKLRNRRICVLSLSQRLMLFSLNYCDDICYTHPANRATLYLKEREKERKKKPFELDYVK